MDSVRQITYMRRLVVPGSFNATAYNANYNGHQKWKVTWQEWILSRYHDSPTAISDVGKYIEHATLNTLKAVETIKATLLLQECTRGEAVRRLRDEQ